MKKNAFWRAPSRYKKAQRRPTQWTIQTRLFACFMCALVHFPGISQHLLNILHGQFKTISNNLLQVKFKIFSNLGYNDTPFVLNTIRTIPFCSQHNNLLFSPHCLFCFYCILCFSRGAKTLRRPGKWLSSIHLHMQAWETLSGTTEFSGFWILKFARFARNKTQRCNFSCKSRNSCNLKISPEISCISKIPVRLLKTWQCCIAQHTRFSCNFNMSMLHPWKNKR